MVALIEATRKPPLRQSTVPIAVDVSIPTPVTEASADSILDPWGDLVG